MSNTVQTTRVDLHCAPKARPAWDFEATRVIVLPNTLEQAAPTRRIALPAAAALPQRQDCPPIPSAALQTRCVRKVAPAARPTRIDNTHTRVDAEPRFAEAELADSLPGLAIAEGTEVDVVLPSDTHPWSLRLPWLALKRCLTVGIVTTVLVGVGFYLGLGATSASVQQHDALPALHH